MFYFLFLCQNVQAPPDFLQVMLFFFDISIFTNFGVPANCLVVSFLLEVMIFQNFWAPPNFLDVQFLLDTTILLSKFPDSP